MTAAHHDRRAPHHGRRLRPQQRLCGTCAWQLSAFLPGIASKKIIPISKIIPIPRVPLGTRIVRTG